MPKDVKKDAKKAAPAKEEKVKGPPSAYMLYTTAQRPKVIAEHPEFASKVTEIAKIIGGKWKALTAEEKKKYEDQAAKLKAEHEKVHGKAVKGAKKAEGGKPEKKAKKEKDPNAPKKEPSTYMKFSNAQRPIVVAEHPELKSKVTEIAKIIGAKWKALTDEQKASYA